MFRELFVRDQFEFDFLYDWILKKQALKQRLAGQTRNSKVDKQEEETKQAV
jgi:hypothetical protein